MRTNFSMPDVLSLELGGGSTCLWDNTSVSILTLNETAHTHYLSDMNMHLLYTKNNSMCRAAGIIAPSIQLQHYISFLLFILSLLTPWPQNKPKLGHSVGHRLISEALCFGGSTCTATDVAVAAGVAPRNICQVSPSVLDSLSPTLVYRTMALIREMIERGIDCVKVQYKSYEFSHITNFYKLHSGMCGISVLVNFSEHLVEIIHYIMCQMCLHQPLCFTIYKPTL